MIVAIHQLHYLPWLRYIHKVIACDTFVVLDSIQFNKNGWQNRNKIKTPQGSSILTVPVLHKMAQSLNEVTIDNKQTWRRKHWGTLVNAYRKAPYFKEHESFFQKVYETEWEKLNDLNYEILFYLVKVLNIKTRIIRGSDLPVPGEATERLVNICKELKASSYLTGAFAAGAYLEAPLFEREGIGLSFQEFHCPQYSQLFPEVGFIPELSILDLLFNCGPSTLEVLMGTGPNSAVIASEAKQSENSRSPRPPTAGSR
jgi:hypothetical protein